MPQIISETGTVWNRPRIYKPNSGQIQILWFLSGSRYQKNFKTIEEADKMIEQMTKWLYNDKTVPVLRSLSSPLQKD